MIGAVMRDRELRPKCGRSSDRPRPRQRSRRESTTLGIGYATPLCGPRTDRRAATAACQPDLSLRLDQRDVALIVDMAQAELHRSAPSADASSSMKDSLANGFAARRGRADAQCAAASRAPAAARSFHASHIVERIELPGRRSHADCKGTPEVGRRGIPRLALIGVDVDREKPLLTNS